MRLSLNKKLKTNEALVTLGFSISHFSFLPPRRDDDSELAIVSKNSSFQHWTGSHSSIFIILVDSDSSSRFFPSLFFAAFETYQAPSRQIQDHSCKYLLLYILWFWIQLWNRMVCPNKGNVILHYCRQNEAFLQMDCECLLISFLSSVSSSFQDLFCTSEFW